MIDHQSYQIDEKSLDDLFGNVFNNLVSRKVTKDDKFNLWLKTYTDWKDQSVKGVWRFETYGDHLGGCSFSGPDIPIEVLGFDAPGKEGSGNPNNEKHVAIRMTIIRSLLARELVLYFTHKTLTI